MENKVKYGLKNVHVWPIKTESETETTYGEVIKIPGAVAISLKAKGENSPFYADDIVYFSEYSNDGYEGDLEIALVPEAFETGILGMTKDKNGAIVESKDAKPKKYAMAFEFDGDATQTRHILYNCISSRTDIDGKTTEGKRDPQTEKISIAAMPRMDNGNVKAKLAKGKDGYDTFFNAPYTVTVVGV